MINSDYSHKLFLAIRHQGESSYCIGMHTYFIQEGKFAIYIKGLQNGAPVNFVSIRERNAYNYSQYNVPYV